MSEETEGVPGWQTHPDYMSEHAQQRFMIEQILGEISTATLVKVTKVENKGEVKAVGKVQVLPLVNMTDGRGNKQEHEPINDIPYWRYQGGSSKAIIMDPKVGDIGILVSADRDTSAVRKSKKQANPGSFRRFDPADGMFIGCMLGEKPTCYIQFTDDDKINMSPDNGTTVLSIEAGKITIKATEIVHNGKVYLGGSKDEANKKVTYEPAEPNTANVLVKP